MKRYSLGTRAFLYASVPMCCLLATGFLTIHFAVKSEVKGKLKASLHAAEELQSQIIADYRRQNGKLLTVLTENAGLKATIGLLRETRTDPQEIQQIHLMIQDQLSELGQSAEYDLLLAADASGQPIAGLVRTDAGIVPLAAEAMIGAEAPLVRVGNDFYETTTLPVNLGEESLAILMMGKKFDLQAWTYSGYAALLEGDKIVLSNLPEDAIRSVEAELRSACTANRNDCEIQLGDQTHLAVLLQPGVLGRNYRLFSLQSEDATLQDFTRGFGSIFILIAAGSLIVALFLSTLISRSLSQPLTKLTALLEESERTGSLRADFPTNSNVEEVSVLAMALNRAGAAAQESRKRLDDAILEFVETMAQALDARDAYTAGHSNRVSANATAIAQAMGLPADEIEIIRIGAKLHDIGKIGVPDTVLQKPGPLTAEEFALVKLHPQIGKKILEKVGRFKEYLPIVELHHEDFNGRGYPYGLTGEQIPIGVRIVHVADVYDAITSNRTYRKAMRESEVLEIIERGAGSQFDPEVVKAFLALHEQQLLLEEMLQQISRAHQEVPACAEVASMPLS